MKKTNKKIMDAYLKVIKEDVSESEGITEKDTLLSLLYDLANEAYATGYGDGSSEHEDRDILEDDSIHDTIVKIEELFDNKKVASDEI